MKQFRRMISFATEFISSFVYFLGCVVWYLRWAYGPGPELSTIRRQTLPEQASTPSENVISLRGKNPRGFELARAQAIAEEQIPNDILDNTGSQQDDPHET